MLGNIPACPFLRLLTLEVPAFNIQASHIVPSPLYQLDVLKIIIPSQDLSSTGLRAQLFLNLGTLAVIIRELKIGKLIYSTKCSNYVKHLTTEWIQVIHSSDRQKKLQIEYEWLEEDLGSDRQ